MNQTNTLTCPVCNNKIYYDVYGLLAGNKYTCPNCSLVISLSSESHSVLSNAMQKYENLRQNSGK